MLLCLGGSLQQQFDGIECKCINKETDSKVLMTATAFQTIGSHVSRLGVYVPSLLRN